MVHFDAKLTGTVEDVSLADLLQLLHYSRKSVTLHVSGTRAGTVILVEGELAHAASADLVGEDALAALLAQKLVRVRTCAVDRSTPRTITRSFGAVILDILRRRDEHKRDTGDLPMQARPIDPSLITNLTRDLRRWLDARPDIEHGALIDPREHFVLACDSPKLWGGLVHSLLMQTLVAPYFDDAFSEIAELLPEKGPDNNVDVDDQQTVVTFGGRRYVLGLVPHHGWVGALIFDASSVSHGLSLTHMVSLRLAVAGWLDGAPTERPATALPIAAVG